MNKKLKVTLVILAVVIGAGAVLAKLLGADPVSLKREYDNKQSAKSIFQEESEPIAQIIGRSTQDQSIEGFCSEYGYNPGVFRCNFHQDFLFDQHGDARAHMEAISKSMYDAKWSADAGNERFFSTFEDYYINKNPESWRPLEGDGTYGENSSYEYGDPSHLSYTKSGQLLRADVQIISGDRLEPSEASGIVSYTSQFEDQIKGIERDRYKIKLTLYYEKTYPL